jgi:hypothetical protein
MDKFFLGALMGLFLGALTLIGWSLKEQLDAQPEIPTLFLQGGIQ